MRRKRTLAAAGVLVFGAALLYYLYGGHETPAGQVPLADLTPQTFATVQSAFNSAPDDVRLLLLLSPT